MKLGSISHARNFTSRDESDIGGTDADDDDPDDVEPRTEDDDDLESSDLVRTMNGSLTMLILVLYCFTAPLLTTNSYLF